MSPKRQVNHNIRKHFNTIIYNISRYAEIALSMVILLVIALAGFRLIMEVADTSVMSMDTEFFSTFLSCLAQPQPEFIWCWGPAQHQRQRQI